MKDPFGDEHHVSPRARCKQCEIEHRQVKGLIVTVAKELGEEHPQVAKLRSQLRKTTYMFTLLNPKFTLALMESHAGVAMRLPCFITHRGAVTMRTLMMITRSASTSQTPNDLEKMFEEFHSITKTAIALRCYGHQAWAAGALAVGDNHPALDHPSIAVTPISDTFIRHILEAWYGTMQRWIHLWSEQTIKCEVCAQHDHHGKRFSRQAKDGLQLLAWRYTKMTEKGYVKLAVNTETCSFSDASLVTASDNDRKADQHYNHPRQKISVLDNPGFDGAGCCENEWLGDGLPLFNFTGAIHIVRTEDEVQEACMELLKTPVLGYDTENVAYFGRHKGTGETSKKAAVLQLCPDSSDCYIFLLHEWESCPAPLKALLEDSTIAKVGVHCHTDDQKINARFSNVTVKGTVDIIQVLKDKVGLPSYSLASMVKFVLGQHINLDKRMDHRLWEVSMNGWIDEWMHRRMDASTNGCIDEWMHRRMDAPTNGCTDEWMHR